MSLRVLIAVTHLLGAGHLTRAAALARAFARKGHETTLVSGGSPARLAALETVTFVQLPPVRTVGTNFKTLLGEDLAPVDAACLERRRTLLLDTLKTVRPDILITELYPFGRRVLADEFSALLDAARGTNPRPLVLCSIRDILVPSSKASRIAETHERVLRDYDAVLVHGDPALVPLEASWPLDERIARLVRYTGYRAAIAASREIADRPWRILIGRGVAELDFLAVQESAPAHVAVERARPDFRALLAGAELSVSQAGYNTTVDLLRCGVRSVLVPFEVDHETEQRLRAERLTALGLAEILPEADLSPQNLADAIRRGLTRAPSPPPSVSIDGARRSVAVAESLAHSMPALHQTIDWSPLDRALDRAKDQGCPLRFWWRDDDAVADTPQLDRLLGLARRYDAGIGLAVIPDGIDASLAARLTQEPKAVALVHGRRHANHAPADDKKAEFGAHRPLDVLASDRGSCRSSCRPGTGFHRTSSRSCRAWDFGDCPPFKTGKLPIP
jgi:predicted glycosyltransferase